VWTAGRGVDNLCRVASCRDLTTIYEALRDVVYAHWKEISAVLTSPWWVGVLLRPRLQITRDHQDADAFPAVRMNGFYLGDAKYIRAFVYNFGARPTKCSVYLDRVLRGNEIVESLRGELKWTDIDTFASQEIKRGIRRGRLIDVCSSWEQQRVLKPETVRGGRGYCFSEPGTYTLEISAEGDKWASAGRLSLDVYFDGENWASLRPVSARERVQWFRLW